MCSGIIIVIYCRWSYQQEDQQVQHTSSPDVLMEGQWCVWPDPPALASPLGRHTTGGMVLGALGGVIPLMVWALSGMSSVGLESPSENTCKRGTKVLRD